MRIEVFTRLTLQEKLEVLYRQGVYIGKHRCGKNIRLLYQLEGYYAEIFYRSYRRVADHISCFSDTARLDPYLDCIDVEALVM